MNIHTILNVIAVICFLLIIAILIRARLRMLKEKAPATRGGAKTKNQKSKTNQLNNFFVNDNAI